MQMDAETIRHGFAGSAVQLVFAFLLGVQLILETGWLPDAFHAPLYPFWLPSYLAFAVASSVRATVLPWLGSGLPFGVVIVLCTYVEAVLLAGLFRVLWNVYRTYGQGRGEPGASS